MNTPVLFSLNLRMLLKLVARKVGEEPGFDFTRTVIEAALEKDTPAVMEAFYAFSKDWQGQIQNKDPAYIDAVAAHPMFGGLKLRDAYEQSTEEEQKEVWVFIMTLYWFSMTSGDIGHVFGGMVGNMLSGLGMDPSTMRLGAGGPGPEMFAQLSDMQNKMTEFLPFMQGMLPEGVDGDMMKEALGNVDAQDLQKLMTGQKLDQNKIDKLKVLAAGGEKAATCINPRTALVSSQVGRGSLKGKARKELRAKAAMTIGYKEPTLEKGGEEKGDDAWQGIF